MIPATLVAQPGQHEPLDNLHGHFDLGLVARPPRTGGEDCGIVVLGQLLVRAVDPELIAANRCDAGLEVVADHTAFGTPPLPSTTTASLRVVTATPRHVRSPKIRQCREHARANRFLALRSRIVLPPRSPTPDWPDRECQR
jgi:hypothetical protein